MHDRVPQIPRTVIGFTHSVLSCEVEGLELSVISIAHLGFDRGYAVHTQRGEFQSAGLKATNFTVFYEIYTAGNVGNTL